MMGAQKADDRQDSEDRGTPRLYVRKKGQLDGRLVQLARVQRHPPETAPAIEMMRNSVRNFEAGITGGADA